MAQVPADVFVGLITHPRSRFPQAQGPAGLLATIAEKLPNEGLSVATDVCSEDLVTPGQLSITPKSVRASIAREMEIENQWREYLNEAPAHVTTRTFLAARKVSRLLKTAPPWRRSFQDSDKAAKALTRLANIELAHLTVMHHAAESGAPWALLLEDDAVAPDPDTFVADLAEFLIKSQDSAHSLSMMNLSESFSIEQLGIQRLLSEQVQKSPRSWPSRVSAKHVTNTVCAVLYQRNFLEDLLSIIDRIPLEPVVPIDFKINDALMRGEGQLPGTTWVCSPAPLIQDSGLPQATTRFTS